MTDKAKAAKGDGLVVVSIPQRRNRAGLKFSREQTYLSYSELTDEQLEALRNDPELVVVEGVSMKKSDVPTSALATEVAERKGFVAAGMKNGGGETLTPSQIDAMDKGEYLPHPSQRMNTTPGQNGVAPTYATPSRAEVEATIKGASSRGDKTGEADVNPTRKGK